MRKIILPLLLGVAVPLLAGASTRLIVHTKDGSEVAYILAQQPRVTFSDNCLVVACDDAEVSYPLADMWKFTFNQTDETEGIAAVVTDEPPLTINDGVIVVSGLNEGSIARISTLGGTIVHSEKLSSDSWTFRLSSLPAGIYLISINNTTFKIAKK